MPQRGGRAEENYSRSERLELKYNRVARRIRAFACLGVVGTSIIEASARECGKERCPLTSLAGELPSECHVFSLYQLGRIGT